MAAHHPSFKIKNLFARIFLQTSCAFRGYSLFSNLNFLQGFFIFVLHVLRNGDVRAAFHRKKQKWLEVKSVTSSRTTHHDSSNMWKNKVSSEANEMSSIPSHVTCRPASGCSNQALVLTQERTMTPVDT